MIEEEEVRSKVLWEGMQLVEPWETEEVADELFVVNPTFIPRDRLSAAQQSVSYSPVMLWGVWQFVVSRMTGANWP